MATTNSSSEAAALAALTETAEHLMAAKMFSLAACVMLFYDIAITFGDEVERVWKRKFNFVTVLWFLNRYLSPLGYIIIIVSFHDPWPKSVCNRYVLFPEALKIVTSFTIGVIFVLRIYAIYFRNKFIAGFACALLGAELAIKIWAFTDGTSLILPPQLVGCILVGRSDLRFSFTWTAELVFDTVMFGLTLWRTIIHNRVRRGNAMSLLSLVVRDGVIYFAVIFIANLVTVLIFLLAEPDIKAINASFSTLITSLMISRLILNLRGIANHESSPSRGKGSGKSYHGDSVPLDTEITANYDIELESRNLFLLRREMSSIVAKA